nr:aminoglycoside phosphotransferase [Spirochaetota bacterium]
MNKGEILGKGMTAEVYEWDDDKVLKLYYDSFSKDCVDFEAHVSKTVFEAGVSSPEVFGIVALEGRLGIVFQRICGQSMLRAIEKKPWKLAFYARGMARMHAQMHLKNIKELPNQKDNLI